MNLNYKLILNLNNKYFIAKDINGYFIGKINKNHSYSTLRFSDLFPYEIKRKSVTTSFFKDL